VAPAAEAAPPQVFELLGKVPRHDNARVRSLRCPARPRESLAQHAPELRRPPRGCGTRAGHRTVQFVKGFRLGVRVEFDLDLAPMVSPRVAAGRPAHMVVSQDSAGPAVVTYEAVGEPVR